MPGILKLWYNNPAKEWTEALPIGNGRLGAMVFGGVDDEHLDLNESTCWSGQAGDEDDEARERGEGRQHVGAAFLGQAQRAVNRDRYPERFQDPGHKLIRHRVPPAC